MFKRAVKKIYRLVFGFFPGVFAYFLDLFRYYRLLSREEREKPFYLFPKIFDRYPTSHTFDKHYVYMDRWAFKNLQVGRPENHVDVGSSIRFLSMASTVTKLKFIDIRPVKIDFDNFECIQGSVLRLPFADNSIESLSCLHVAEHVGLGRYGDPLDPLGTKKACEELSRVLKAQGRLYFALPIGAPAIYFNAHRVHDPLVILEYFSDLRLLGFSAVNDQGNFVGEARLEDYINADYACGMYVFTK